MAPWTRVLGAAVALAAVAAETAATAAAAVAEGRCKAGQDGPECAAAAATIPPEGAAAAPASPLGAAAAAAGDGEDGKPLPLEELSVLRAGVVLSFLVFLALWILGSIKFALDGSLPARLALWGLLPEAYAAISVPSVVALLRLKTGETPVVVLRSCVDDAGAKELAAGLLRYGRKAGLQALELPHNPAMTEAGLKSLASMVLEKDGPPLQELDLSYNQQLGDAGAEHILPLLQPKACQVTTLNLADCGLSPGFVERFAERAAVSKLRVLDLSGNALAGAGEALVTLMEAPVLEGLSLSCCELRLEDVRAVAEQLPYTSLRSLALGGNRLGRAGLAVLAEHLPRSCVDELGLEGNELRARDLDPLGQAWVKRPFSRLRLTSNRMTPQEVSAFIRTLKSIHS